MAHNLQEIINEDSVIQGLMNQKRLVLMNYVPTYVLNVQTRVFTTVLDNRTEKVLAQIDEGIQGRVWAIENFYNI